MSDIKSQIVNQNEVKNDKKNKKVQVIYEPNNNSYNSNNSNKESFFVLADRPRLIQVISNILDNAIKFTRGNYFYYYRSQEEEE